MAEQQNSALSQSSGVEHEISVLSVANLEKELVLKEQEVTQLIDNHRELQR